MRFFSLLRIAAAVAATCLCLQGQTPPAKDAQSDARGLPPRSSPADYQAQAQAGAVTIGAEFTAHDVRTAQGVLSHEDYVAVEVGMFGPPGTLARIDADDFMLRINGKSPLPSRPFGLVLMGIKDPEWTPPGSKEAKSKSALNAGGGGENDAPPPSVEKMPFAMQRALAQRVQKAVLPEGDRPLPVAGLLFFRYTGQAKGIHSVELIYAGSAGKAKLELHP
jgi:hypothetical protein